MPPKKAEAVQCRVCQSFGPRYKDPKSGAPYCSVACFKTLKAQQEPVIPSEPVVEPVKPEEEEEEEVLPVAKPLRRLQDLKWPPEPDPSLWQDPLKRDDPKPLRQDQYLAIAQSQKMRDFLEQTKGFEELLKSVFEGSRNPEVGMRTLLGLDPPRGDAGAPRGRGRGQRGRGRGRGGFHPQARRHEVAPETVQLMRCFADLIQEALAAPAT